MAASGSAQAPPPALRRHVITARRPGNWTRPPEVPPPARGDHAPIEATPPRVRRRVRPAHPRRPRAGFRSGHRRGPAPGHVSPRRLRPPSPRSVRAARLPERDGRAGGLQGQGCRVLPRKGAAPRGGPARTSSGPPRSRPRPPPGARDAEAAAETSQPGDRDQRGAPSPPPGRALLARSAPRARGRIKARLRGWPSPGAARDAAPLGRTRGSL